MVVINIRETSTNLGAGTYSSFFERSKLNKSEVLSVASTAFSAIMVVAFQLGLLPFFQPLVAETLTWRFIYYGFWMAILVVAILVFLTNTFARRKSIPTLLVCGISLLLVLSHPPDQIAKNYIVAMIVAGCVVVMVLDSVPLLLLRFSASITALSAVICLLDILFADGFTNTMGRAAGLGINPNVAAASLLLGASASFWAVPGKWRLSFLILVGSGIFVTLSRSTILIAGVIVCMTLLVEMAKSIRKGLRTSFEIPGWRQAAIVAVAVMASVLTAVWANDRFSVAASDALGGLRGAVVAFEKVSNPIQKVTDGILASQQDSSGRSESEERKRDQRVSARIAAIGIAADDEGQINSVSARALLFERSWLAYTTGPMLGEGLAAAHALLPHNTYLMFAVALGHAGWLVPLGFIGLAFYGNGGRKHFQLGAATAALMATSHDILLTPGLLIPIVLGISSRAGRCQVTESPRIVGALKYVAVTSFALFLLGCATVFFRFEAPFVGRLDASLFQPDIGFGYLASIPRPPFSGLIRIGKFDPDKGADGHLPLREDGVLLSDRPTSIDEVENVGKGRYSIWKRRTMVFSSSDNSSPRSNGRNYEIAVPVSIHSLLFLVLASLLIWCIGVVRTRARSS